VKGHVAIDPRLLARLWTHARTHTRTVNFTLSLVFKINLKIPHKCSATDVVQMPLVATYVFLCFMKLQPQSNYIGYNFIAECMTPISLRDYRDDVQICGTEYYVLIPEYYTKSLMHVAATIQGPRFYCSCTRLFTCIGCTVAQKIVDFHKRNSTSKVILCWKIQEDLWMHSWQEADRGILQVSAPVAR
jgi:hypothetical protein